MQNSLNILKEEASTPASVFSEIKKKCKFSQWWLVVWSGLRELMFYFFPRTAMPPDLFLSVNRVRFFKFLLEIL